MTNKAKEFLQFITLDEAGREKASKLSGLPELLAMAREMGYELSEADFEQSGSGEIDEDELAAVAGGGECACFAGGGGTPGEVTKVCACVAVGMGLNKKGERRCFCFTVGHGGDY